MNSKNQGFLVFGQYRQGYPLQPLQVVFSLKINDNATDDWYVLILDVYDHTSDRLLGKRVLTRKDFERANAYCLFSLDFIPPSPAANMEFRIYYMGGAAVCADKIAVLDPHVLTIQEASQIPSPEIIPSNPPPIVTPPPVHHDPDVSPWSIARFGKGDGVISDVQANLHVIRPEKGEAWLANAMTFETHGAFPDDLLFVYLIWQKQFGYGNVFIDLESIQGMVGVMIRESLAADARFILATIDNKVYLRDQRGGPIRQDSFAPPPPYLSLGISREGYLSMNNEVFWARFKPAHDIVSQKYPLALPDHNLYVGLIVGTCTGRLTLTAKFKDEKYRHT